MLRLELRIFSLLGLAHLNPVLLIRAIENPDELLDPLGQLQTSSILPTPHSISTNMHFTLPALFAVGAFLSSSLVSAQFPYGLDEYTTTGCNGEAAGVYVPPQNENGKCQVLGDQFTIYSIYVVNYDGYTFTFFEDAACTVPTPTTNAKRALGRRLTYTCVTTDGTDSIQAFIAEPGNGTTGAGGGGK